MNLWRNFLKRSRTETLENFMNESVLDFLKGINVKGVSHFHFGRDAFKGKVLGQMYGRLTCELWRNF